LAQAHFGSECTGFCGPHSRLVAAEPAKRLRQILFFVEEIFTSMAGVVISSLEGSKGASGPLSVDKDGLETSDTGTPPPRSVSPSSAGGESVPRSEQSAALLEGPLGRQRAKEAEATQEGGSSTAIVVADAELKMDASRLAESTPPTSSERRTGAEGVALSAKDKRNTKVVKGKAGRDRAEAQRERRGKDAIAEPQQASQASEDSKSQPPMPMSFAGYPMTAAFSSQPMAGLMVGGQSASFSDRRIIQVLAAPEKVHKRLMETAKRVPEILLSDADGPALSGNVELYGSLSLDMDMKQNDKERGWEQDWSTYYINGRSDVDFVVEVGPDQKPSAIADFLQSKGKWERVNMTQVHKFASTQYTLLGSFADEKDGDATKVYLDITCIESPLHYSRFKRRQEAFRTVFTDVRYYMEAQFAGQGALAYDAYIHLLKAFAAKVPGNALTGFQATCIGLFTLQIGHYRFKHSQSIALSLFEGFLRFCRYFFAETHQNNSPFWQYHYHTCGIDLSGGGRWIPRQNLCWRSELYFMAAEVKMNNRLDERVNVLHSLDPVRVTAEAQSLLLRAFQCGPSAVSWFQPQIPGQEAPPMMATSVV